MAAFRSFNSKGIESLSDDSPADFLLLHEYKVKNMTAKNKKNEKVLRIGINLSAKIKTPGDYSPGVRFYYQHILLYQKVIAERINPLMQF